MRTLRPYLLVGLSLIAAPIAAQNSVQDFTLPPPSPTPTPRAQGPVDDTGVVPVAPRAIPTSTPTPAPTPTAAPSPVPTGAAPPVTVPAPRPTSSPVARQPQPQTQPVLPPPAAGTQTPPPSAALPPQPVEPSDVPSADSGAPLTLPTGIPDSDIADDAESDSPFPTWLIGLLSALGLLVVGWAWWAFKRRPRTVSAPTIEPPIVAGAGDDTLAAVEKQRCDVRIEITSAMRSMMKVTVAFHATIANRSDRALRDLDVSADLVSARRSGGGEQLAGEASELPVMESIERIGPHQSRTATGTVELPVADIEVLRQGQVPMFVPLLRLKVAGPGIETLVRTYAVGVANEMVAGKVHPLPLNGPPGNYHGVRAAAIDPVAA